MFIPKRNEIKKVNTPMKNKIEITPVSRENVGKIYELVDEFLPTFNLTETKDDNKISMTQLVRFQELVASRNYSFTSNGVLDFINDQIKRGIGKHFYQKFLADFQNEEYLFDFPDTNNESIKKGINRKVIDSLVLTMRAARGEIRVKKILEENN